VSLHNLEVDGVAAWAKVHAKLSPKAIGILVDNEVNGTALLMLTEARLEKCGMPMGSMLNLLAAIKVAQGSPAEDATGVPARPPRSRFLRSHAAGRRGGVQAPLALVPA
jgi:hypothetical protein